MHLSKIWYPLIKIIKSQINLSSLQPWEVSVVIPPLVSLHSGFMLGKWLKMQKCRHHSHHGFLLLRKIKKGGSPRQLEPRLCLMMPTQAGRVTAAAVEDLIRIWWHCVAVLPAAFFSWGRICGYFQRRQHCWWWGVKRHSSQLGWTISDGHCHWQAIRLFFWWCPWCNCYRRRKWTRRLEFKSWTRLITFHIALIPLGKVWIQLFSLQLWVNSRTDWVLRPWWGNWSRKRKTLNSNLSNSA